jgi:Rrf2 family protein
MSKLVQIPESTSLAFYSMAIVAGSTGTPVSVKEIASRTGASTNHLAKVMQRLVKEGFVHSTRGPHGGFTIAVNPEEISFYDIYEAMEGSVMEYSCPFGRTKCPFNSCFYGGLIEDLTGEFVKFLKKKKLTTYVNP